MTAEPNIKHNNKITVLPLLVKNMVCKSTQTINRFSICCNSWYLLPTDLLENIQSAATNFDLKHNPWLNKTSLQNQQLTKLKKPYNYNFLLLFFEKKTSKGEKKTLQKSPLT
jgi:hypothetical protein